MFDLFDKITKLQPIKPGSQKSKYLEQALAEIETNNIQKTTWAVAYTEADGDESKAKARYMRLRAEQLEQEQQASEAAGRQAMVIGHQQELVKRKEKEMQITLQQELVKRREKEMQITLQQELVKRREKENAPWLGVKMSPGAYEVAGILLSRHKKKSVYDYGMAKALIQDLNGTLTFAGMPIFGDNSVKVRLWGKENSFENKYDFSKWVVLEITPRVIAEYEASQQGVSDT